MTEVNDLVNVLYKAIPAKYRPKGKLGMARKMEFIYRNAGKIDWSDALAGYIYNEAEDRLVGGFMRMAPRPSSLRLGPAGMGGFYVQPKV